MKGSLSPAVVTWDMVPEKEPGGGLGANRVQLQMFSNGDFQVLYDSAEEKLSAVAAQRHGSEAAGVEQSAQCGDAAGPIPVRNRARKRRGDPPKQVHPPQCLD